ncbi:unnamed protein product [Prunus armeniaca]|uniref:RNase H type-1 domain-containing protein n=1 Tax=Prunus armeniaca TaxID=36596 RepID=A0A6J5VPE2_PRUAR|nr:unnamed protein product [Prunus armeniaca]
MAVDFCKFNVDGALNMSSGTRGGGMVVRDSVGCFYDAVALRAPSLLYVLATKLYALKFGISFAIDASFFPLVIETNSLSATHFILKDEVCYAAERVLVEDIHHLLASVSSCFVHYVPWTASGVAYHIACFSLSQDDLSFWFEEPPSLLWDCPDSFGDV